LSLPTAYCQQLDSVIDIVRAHDYYYSQKQPRPDLDFFCPDQQCREESWPRITGVNYNKLPKIDAMVQRAHFRLTHPEKHRAGCPWVEVKEAIEEFDGKAGTDRLSNLKRSQLINLFDPADDGNPEPRIDAAQVQAVSALPTRRARIEAYKAYLRENPNRTSRLQEVAFCFERMTPDERSKTDLTITGVGKKTYRQHFTAAKYCSPTNPTPRIYYGYASVYEWPDYFNLRFRQSAKQDDGQTALVNVRIQKDLLERFRGKGVVLATLLTAKETGGNPLSCHAFGNVVRTDPQGKARIDIQIRNLHSLSVMLTE
jgi:hypothetical protein